MNAVTSLGILILVALIHAFFQLTPGIFMLFYHTALGKYSKKSASKLALFFILGAETRIALFFIIAYFLSLTTFYNWLNFENGIFGWIIIGILLTTAIFIPFFYFRKGPGSRLFISRKCAKNIDLNIKLVKNSSDAFMLGFLSGLPELIFMLPLYFIAAIETMHLSDLNLFRALSVFAFLIISIFPLLSLHSSFETNHNLAELQRFREKNKNFALFNLTFCYLLVTTLILVFRVL